MNSSDFEIENGILIRYRGSDKNVIIPDGVKEIGERAFEYCESLTAINIPDSVTEIGESAFSHCKSLISINIPDSVTRIGEDTFFNCSSLTEIQIPKSVTQIEESAFEYTHPDYTWHLRQLRRDIRKRKTYQVQDNIKQD